MIAPARPAEPPPPDHLPLTRRELALIAAFWTVYAALAVASRVFDGGPGPKLDWRSGQVAVAVAESLWWAALTPLVFNLANRFGGERGKVGQQIALFMAVGIAAATILSLGGEAMRGLLHRPPPGPRRPPPPGPPLWFGFVNAVVIYLGVLAAGLARAYSLRYRARREQAVQLQAQLAEAHLDALRRQLDPHFLFNTLNAVSSLVERDPRGVRRMIARLSELLRYSLEEGDEPEIPLRQELELLGRYLDIMQVRFQGRLQIEQRIDDVALDALVPTLLLQPLVENAIKHGVERLGEGGRIVIEAEVNGETLVLRVRDNGGEPGRLVAESPSESGTGIGLRNTVARLERLYGGRQSFSLAPAANGVMVAEVRLPFRAESVVYAG
jgi:two-component system, LytTR family, sensor kinase